MNTLFNQIRELVLSCQDACIRDEHGRVTQVGMGLGDNLYIMTNAIEKGVNSLYINEGCDMEFEIQESDEYILKTFWEVFEQMKLEKQEKEARPKAIICPRCKNEEHRKEARFCKICGLDIRPLKSKVLSEELQDLASPIVQYLEKHYDPYCEVVIRADGIKLNRNEMSLPAMHPDVKRMIDNILDM